MKLQPDVILYNANNKEHAKVLESSGIPAVAFATVGSDSPADPLERYKQWLSLLEDVFGEDGKMDAFFEKGDRSLLMWKDGSPKSRRTSGRQP